MNINLIKVTRCRSVVQTVSWQWELETVYVNPERINWIEAYKPESDERDVKRKNTPLTVLQFGDGYMKILESMEDFLGVKR